MTKFEKDIINLIDCSISGKNVDVNNLDYQSIYKFCYANQIIGLVFPTLSKDKNFQKSNIYSQFFNSYVYFVNVSENQLLELDLLFKEFDKNNVNYVPLKGILLKKLYLTPEMRTMGDADIFIDLSQIIVIKKILKELGYEFQYESDHELGFQKGEFHLELHKRLIPSYNKDYYEYYGDGWKIVKDNKIGIEDNFIFLFTHFAKHYRDAGVGIKYIIDLYVYLNYYKDIDKSYIENELKKLSLSEFYRNVMATIDVWFNGGKSTEKTDYITEFIFSCGVYGKSNLKNLSNGLKISKERKNLKFTGFIRLLFPSYKSMKNKYHVLRSLPILLPFTWVLRWFKVLFFKRKKIKQQLDVIKDYTKENVDSYQKHLNFVGLDYNFKEEKKKDEIR